MQGLSLTHFADAGAPFEEARYVIVGVPFDRTTSYRPGARFAPDAIRAASWHYETLDLETGVDLAAVPVHDAGNTEEFGTASDMAEGVREVAQHLWKSAKFPIVLGGDHACAAPVVEAIPDPDSVGVLYLDAHMDFREEYLGDTRSHACSSRRMTEHIGPKNLVVLGVRSVSKEEIEEIPGLGLHYITAHQVRKEGIEKSVRDALALLGTRKVYISLDIDVIDPAYAGGTGTPEPFGLTPVDIKTVIDTAAPRLVGLDIMEVSPPNELGNTSALAARFVRETVARTWKAWQSNPA